MFPAGATEDERALIRTLSAGPEYLRALLLSQWRQEILFTEIRDLLAAEEVKPARAKAAK